MSAVGLAFLSGIRILERRRTDSECRRARPVESLPAQPVVILERDTLRPLKLHSNRSDHRARLAPIDPFQVNELKEAESAGLPIDAAIGLAVSAPAIVGFTW
jgi:hypothetical protein